MCGIAGALVFGGSEFRLTDDYLSRMRDSMSHRGPDGAGNWLSDDRTAGLAHRRLSIIDLSPSASQPMSNGDGSLWVSFNGEIYNHREIREELERLGFRSWKTSHSDTEVLLHAFEAWGIDCLQRFRGMFAFALWDVRRKELWLVRDRIGIKPLYYSVHHRRVVFASEIKALLTDPEQRRELDEEGAFHYLSFLTTPAPMTMFAGIRKVPPATWLRFRGDGSCEQKRYWSVWANTQDLGGLSYDDICDRVLEELRASVRLRKEGDVPVGVFLSGGVDSSTNAALFSEGAGDRVKTFSVGYDRDYGTNPSELIFARSMARRIGSDHHERVLRESDFLEFLPRMVALQDEPLGDPVCMPIYYVSQLARSKGVVVCQVGEGADELFWGYPGWKLPLFLQKADDLPIPGQVKRAGLKALTLAGRGKTRYFEWLRRGSAGLPVFWGGTDALPEAQKHALLSGRLRTKLRGLSSWEALSPIFEAFKSEAWEPSPLNWMSFADLSLRLPELMLMRIDKMTMGVGLEGRVPFLDHKFVETAMSIPQSMKTRGGRLKGVLKHAVRDIVPREVTERRKQGFDVPVVEWFRGRLGDAARTSVRKFCRDADILDAVEVEMLFDSGRGRQAWYLLNLALWWEHYISDAPH